MPDKDPSFQKVLDALESAGQIYREGGRYGRVPEAKMPEYIAFMAPAWAEWDRAKESALANFSAGE